MDDLARFYAYYVIYPVFGVGFVALAAARLPRNRARMPAIVLAAAIAIGALFLEHIVAHAEFETLCRKEAGGRILATVELPPEYFNARGEATYFDLNPGPEARRLNARFRRLQSDAPFASAWNEISAHSVTLVDFSTNTLLAEYRRLSAPNRLPPLVSDSGYGPCPKHSEEKAFLESLSGVFKRAAT